MIFRHKWNLKKKDLLCTPIFIANPNIMRHPTYLKKYFPKLIELTNFAKFAGQKKDGSEYCEYKLGGMFELNVPNIDYLIKIIVFPNAQLIF